jgi:8-oxo-dGTP pyrophosphatase MutT (NUDIX family)
VDAIVTIHSERRLDKLSLMAETLVPRAAATVLTLRDAANGYEILMLRRNVRSEFMGGVFVFPGGAVDDEDAAAPVYGLTDEVASQRLGLERGGLAFYVACLRELFEEAGLLIVSDDQGQERRFTTATELERLASYRRALNGGETTLAEVLRSENVCLDLRGIAYLSHWITPVGMPRRYDTRFFVALAPEGQPATHDANETVADRWMRPVEALSAQRRGEFDMVPPTIKNLEAIAEFSSPREVLDFARALGPVPAIQPRLLERDGAIVIVVPGDEGFDSYPPDGVHN